MRKYLFPFVITLLLACSICEAQTPKPPCNLPADLCENAWTVSLTGAYSNFSGVATNNGFEAGAAVRFAKHWAGAARMYSTASPQGNILLFGPEYHFSAAHILPTTGTFSAQNVEFFTHVGAGLGWSQAAGAGGTTINGPKKFAFGLGGGADYTVNSSVTLRLVEVTYVRAPLLQNGGQFIGNHLGVVTGLKLTF